MYCYFKLVLNVYIHIQWNPLIMDFQVPRKLIHYINQILNEICKYMRKLKKPIFSKNMLWIQYIFLHVDYES
jgi:hypothetical protein